MTSGTPDSNSEAAVSLQHQIELFRQQLAEEGLSIELDSALPIFEQFSRLQQAVLDEIRLCRRESATALDVANTLEKSEAQLNAIVENLSEGVVVSTVDGQLLHWNRAALEMHGFQSIDEVRNRLPELAEIFELSTIDGVVLPLEQWPLSRILRGEKVRDLNLRIRRIHADWQRVFCYGGVLVCDERGQPLMAVVTVSDVTHRKEIEDEQQQLLRQVSAEQSRLRTVLNTLPIGVLIVDERNHILETNDHVERVYSGSATLTQPIQEYRKGKAWWTDTGKPVEENDWPSMQAIKTGKVVPGGDITLLRADGTRAVVYDTAAPLRDEEGRIVGAVVVIQDITTLKEAQEELMRLNETLEQRVRDRTMALEAANNELEAFSYSVSHDLRAPLRSIDGFSRILVEQYPDRLDERGRDYLERVRNAAQRMGRLIDDMLRLSRIGRAEMKRDAVDLSVLAELVIDDLRQRDPERRVEVAIMPGMQVKGDADLLRIVLENLIGNAWKFTGKREDARIEVGREMRDHERVYYVRDNGAGFNMAYAEKLFTPFQRLHTEEEFPGTGIGLAIVQRIIARHGGRVWAEGAEGRGATIYFTLGEG